MSENEPSDDLPQNQTSKNTAEMGFAMFDMAHDKKYRALANLLTKTNLPGVKRGLYLNAINTALVLKRKGMPKTADVIMNRAATDLMAMVSEKGKRMQEFREVFELELHRDTKRPEEKLKV